MLLVEGSFLVTREDLIFEVKGIVHPKDRVIAYLRYVPSERGDRMTRSGKRYRKIYDLREREKYLEKRFPRYLRYDENHGRRLQAVDRKDIACILEATDALGELRDLGHHMTALESDSLALVSRIVESADIELEEVGITGSQLLSLSIDSSDIDIVVYGSEAARKVYSTMDGLFRDGIVERYSGGRLCEHVNFRWGGIGSNSAVSGRIEEKKHLQGIFRDREFYIKLVKLPSELDYEYEDRIYRQLGLRSEICRITDNSDSIFTPSMYLVDCDSCSAVERIVSFRGRFAEQASVSSTVEVSGAVELVSELDSGKEYSQFVLGERSTDYMIPLEYAT